MSGAKLELYPVTRCHLDGGAAIESSPIDDRRWTVLVQSNLDHAGDLCFGDRVDFDRLEELWKAVDRQWSYSGGTFSVCQVIAVDDGDDSARVRPVPAPAAAEVRRRCPIWTHAPIEADGAAILLELEPVSMSMRQSSHRDRRALLRAVDRSKHAVRVGLIRHYTVFWHCHM